MSGLLRRLGAQGFRGLKNSQARGGGAADWPGGVLGIEFCMQFVCNARPVAGVKNKCHLPCATSFHPARRIDAA